MTGVVFVRWELVPAHPPIPLRHCGTCGGQRPFHSSGKIRLNANGHALDAWLIYKCESCDRTWNRPLYERQRVAAFDPDTLEALQHSRADWVRRIEEDTVGLKHHATQIRTCAEVRVRKPAPVEMPETWEVLTLSLTVPTQTGMRLDRLLAQEFDLSRSALTHAARAGLLKVDLSPKALRKTLRSDLDIWISRQALAHLGTKGLTDRLFA